MRKQLVATLLLLVLAHNAFGQKDSSPRQHLKLPEMAALGLPFTDAILVNDTLYLSGTGGVDVSTMSVPDDPRAEVRLLMNNVRRTLALADMTIDDLVSVTVFCPDLSLYDVFNEVYREFFEGDFPTRAFIGSGELLFGMRFELQAVAVE